MTRARRCLTRFSRLPARALLCGARYGSNKVAEAACGTVGKSIIACARVLVATAVCAGLATDAAAQGSVETDRRALVALFDATGGVNWTDNTNWKTAAPLNQWYGVQTNLAGRVVSLDLRGNALDGSIPSRLGDLTYLSWLVLFNNDLVGTLPAALRNLDHLNTLDLGGNALTGDVPAWLGDLSNLRNLVLWGNELTGPMPAALRKLSKLEWLNLSNNALTGAVPAWLGDLRNLRRLWLNGNELTGPIPTALRKLDKLDTLDLGGNDLTGAVPAWLGELANLRSLSLWGSGLTGPIPTALRKLDKLELLNLNGNNLTGGVPAWFGDLASLRSLRLWENELHGPIPTSLRKLDELETLDLGGNALTGPIPEWLGSMSSLQRLSLRGNELTGLIPVALTKLENLESLRLNGNNLTGSIPAGLGELGNLEWLNLSSNALAYPIPRELGELAKLKRLYLGSNALTDAVPAALGNLENLEVLDVSWNPVGGALPQRLAQLSRLKRLDIRGTAACAPADKVFQAWLATREFHGARCNRGPQPVDAIPAQTLTVPSTQRVSVGAYFSDPDDDQLTYTAESNRTAYVTSVVSGDTVWLSARDAGQATVTVAACDPDRLCAEQTMDVTVRAGSTASQSDRDALVALFDATGGADWTNKANWRTTAPIGTWHGVTTDGLGRVTRLDLASNGLTGTIPAALRSLDKLENLNLRGNALTGPVPAWLGSVSSLRWLVLAWNELTGPIPAELGNMRNLRQLDLGGNELTGDIPAALRNLVNLEHLVLGGNSLTGRIPTWVARLGSLRTLYLDRNELTGRIPNGLGNLWNLRRLVLGDNDLTSGPIPADLSDLVNLETLRLEKTNRTGPIPAQLGKLANLRILNLHGNGLTGTIPDELARLTNLRNLDLGENWALSGPLPTEWQPPDLEVLDIFLTQACAPEVWQENLETIDFLGGICGAEENQTIDVAFVYTPLAKQKAGGTDAVEAEIDLMIAATNQAFNDSGVRSRVALVDRSEMAYEETGDSLIDVGRLINPSDGHMDEVHEMRARVGADLVHLIVGESDACRAQLAGVFGISTQGSGDQCVPHELGHNLGLRHDRFEQDDNGAQLLFDPAYGYVNQRAFEADTPRSARWRTIMSYPTQCTDEFTLCAWLPRFSNPHQRYKGDPIGVPYGNGRSNVSGPVDAVAVLNVTGPVVAAWRDRPPTDDSPAAAARAGRAVSLAAVGGLQPAAPAQSDGLFVAVAQPDSRAAFAPEFAASSDALSLRRRVVSIDFGQLGVSADELALNLFDDAVFTGVVERTAPTFSGGYVLSGQLDGVEMGTVTLVVNGDVVAGTVWTPEATYRISSAGGGLHAISEIDRERLPPLGDPLPRRQRDDDPRVTPQR